MQRRFYREFNDWNGKYSLSVLKIFLGFCIYAARQIHMAVFRRFALERYSALFCLYSALFCRILQILGKMTLVPCKLTGDLVDDLKSAVEGFNREGSDS